MAPCTNCKIEPKEPLKSCVCGKVSYCSKECQVKDWKAHKPSCPPFVIRESPGKGRGLFATRKIKEGQIIIDEYPLLINSSRMHPIEFMPELYPYIDEKIKAEILQFHDPAEDIKILDPDTVKKLVSKDPDVRFYIESSDDMLSKITRIIAGNAIQICGEEDLYNTNEIGLYHKISLINHACVANANCSWVMGDFKRKQVRAIMTLEKDQEILVSYRNNDEFHYGSREFRQKELLEIFTFKCGCSECSLEGWDLEDNDGMREEIREMKGEISRLLSGVGSDSRKDLKKAMKLKQKQTDLVVKLNIRAGILAAMISFYRAATEAKRTGVPCMNDPDIYKQEALKYAKIFGDNYLHQYNQNINKYN